MTTYIEIGIILKGILLRSFCVHCRIRAQHVLQAIINYVMHGETRYFCNNFAMTSPGITKFNRQL